MMTIGNIDGYFKMKFNSSLLPHKVKMKISKEEAHAALRLSDAQVESLNQPSANIPFSFENLLRSAEFFFEKRNIEAVNFYLDCLEECWNYPRSSNQELDAAVEAISSMEI